MQLSANIVKLAKYSENLAKLAIVRLAKSNHSNIANNDNYTTT